MGLLDILRGVADQADFIPGVDPNKDSRGLISQLLGMNKQPVNPSGMPPIVPQNAVQKRSAQAPGGAMPNPFQQFAKPRGPLARLLTPNSYDRQYDAGHQNFLAEQSNRYTAQQALAASQRQTIERTKQGKEAGLQGRELLDFVTSGEVPSIQTITKGDSYLSGNTVQQAPMPFEARTDSFGRGQSFNPNTGQFGAPQGDAKPVSVADGADLVNPLTNQSVYSNPKTASGPLVQIGADGQRYSSISDVPIGQPIPEKLLGGVKLPEGMFAARVEGGPGFEFQPIPGSAAESKVRSREDSSTIDTLINDYATLARNKAITSRNNSAADNAAAIYSGSFLGRRQDQLGGDVGNIDNYEARSNIEGLSMNALMKMISMSDVSAKAMDSDAEMKAWLSAIKSDNYESALTKLHVLDQSFGSGDALQRAFEDGVIDQATYQWVTHRVETDPFTQRMAQKAQRYASLGGEIGADNFTPSETESVDDLLEFMTPEERALFGG